MRIRATLILATLIVAATGARSDSVKHVSLNELADDPGRYLGHELELPAVYCTEGGVGLQQGGYHCSTDGKIWIAARAVSPSSAKKKVDAQCGGLDVIEHSSFCRARVRFTPSSMEKANTTVDPPNTVLLLYAPDVRLTF